MNVSIWRRLSLMFAVMVYMAHANAGVVEGSFSGIAFGSRIDATSPSPRNFDGEVVTGTFRFDTAGLYEPEVKEPDYYFGFVAPGSLQLVFKTQGHTSIFGGEEGGDAVFVEPGASGPVVSLIANYSFPYYFAGLVLAAPLITEMDPATLQPGAFDLENSFAYFFAGRDFGAAVTLTALTFKSYELSEPSSALLVLAGLGALGGGAQWRRRMQAVAACGTPQAPQPV